MKKRVLFVWLLCLTLACLSNRANSASTFQGKYFEFSAPARDAYQKTVELRLNDANQQIGNMRRQEPDNLIAIFLENTVEFLSIITQDDEAAYKRQSKQMDKRLSAISRGDTRSPYYLYTQAEIRLQWAVLRGRFGDYLSSLSDIKLAYALLEENQRRFPDFVANKKSLGILHALVGNIPDNYRWAIKAVGGMNGSIEQGLSELDQVLAYAQNNDFVFEQETLLAYCFLQSHLNNQGDQAWSRLKNSRLNPGSSPLVAYAMANLAVKTGKTDEAINLLEKAPQGSAYSPFQYRQYLLGIAKLYRLDQDANVPLENFIQTFKGQNAVKECCQKLAWYYLLNNNEQGYWNNMYLAKTRGASQSDPDKAALREAESGEKPDVRLLKARLLFDGGYYRRAYDLLKNAGNEYQNSYTKWQLEYTYRMGRIAHKLGKKQEAIGQYNATMAAGVSQPWYFACNAALQLGLLYEESGDRKNAATAFRRCLDIKPKEYADSLHAKAKAGLSRVK
ncbi:MAG: tetratricopeptide repeat protein [Saprospiraceae bacterium]|nr:tetratricopeptide repeat protein [Saprospiraceae bacterium]